MIKVEHESKEWENDVPENCIFCKADTRHWHKATNTPVCLCCAGSRSAGEMVKVKNPPIESKGFWEAWAIRLIMAN